MLYEICLDLRNFFDRGQPRLVGNVDIVDGKIQQTDFLEIIQENQYFRISGSVFNDGVYKYNDSLELTDESFKGVIQLMAIPKEFLSLVADIEAWQAKYGAVDGSAMSPFNSESFGGYSYMKGYSGGGSEASGGSWQKVFGNRLNRWRKI